MKKFLFFLILFFTTHYLSAQTYQQDTASISQLLKSAKSKRFTDSTTALKEGFQALALAKKHNDSYWISKSCHRLGRIHSINGQKEKAHLFYLEALTIEKEASAHVKNDIYVDVINSYVVVNDLPNANKYILKLYELGEKTQNMAIQQEALLQLGTFYQGTYEFEKATQHLVKSVEMSLKINNYDNLCKSYRELAGVYLKTKNYDLAIKNSYKTIEIIDKVNTNNFSHYYIYMSHGKILAKCGRKEESLKFMYKSIEMCRKDNDKAALSTAYITVADTYKKMNKIDSANHYFNLCQKLFSTMPVRVLMDYNQAYGELLLEKGSNNDAIKHFKESIVLAEKSNSKISLQISYNLISEAYEKIGDKDNSLFFLKKALLLRDSIYTDENTKRTADAQFKFDLTQSQDQLKTMKSRQTYTIVGSLFVLLCLAVAFLSYFLRSKNEKNRLLIRQTEVLTEKTNIIDNKNRQLKESNEILRQFAFASAHDLKEPLRNINSFVNILQKRFLKDAPTEAHEYMGFVTVGVKRMESLLNALLEFSSVLTEENVVHKNNEISLVLKDVFYHYQNIIEEKKAVIRYPSVFPQILMNEAHLKQIMFNLVQNALKFSKVEAKIEVGYALTENEFILSVKDEGIGMDASYGDKIFKLFQRLDRATHKESAGIGLSICKNIVDKYDGRIWFESVVNEGTTFYIAFPKSMVSKIPSTKTPLSTCLR